MLFVLSNGIILMNVLKHYSKYQLIVGKQIFVRLDHRHGTLAGALAVCESLSHLLTLTSLVFITDLIDILAYVDK